MNIAKYSVFGRRYGNPLLLDTYSGELGLTLRQVKEGYTGYMLEVRRSSDNALAYIGLSGGVLDTSALTAHVGGGNGYVRTWYDQQSGNNAVQTTNSLQPRIVTSGTVETVNGKPAVFFEAGNYMNLTAITMNSAWGVFTVGKRFAASTAYCPISGVTGSPSTIMHYSDNNFYFQKQGVTPGYLYSSSTDSGASQMLLSAFARTSTQYMYKNGSVITSSFGATSIGNTLERIGRYADYEGKGHVQEVILYNSDAYVNRADIALNINTYYTIY